MNFNFDAVATDMLSAMKGILSDNWPKVESIAKQFMQNREKRLEMVAESYLKGEITQQKLESRLQDEMDIFEAEIAALKVVSKALAQKAINTAINILLKALKAAI
jgi:hypothetical protein